MAVSSPFNTDLDELMVGDGACVVYDTSLEVVACLCSSCVSSRY